MYITINGETKEVTGVHTRGYLPQIETDDGHEYYIAESAEDAGIAAREDWEDMANDDPTELAGIIGDKVLIAWGLGQWAGPGSVQTFSLSDWLDLWLDIPEEQWGEEMEARGPSCALLEAIDLDYDREVRWVAYRCN